MNLQNDPRLKNMHPLKREILLRLSNSQSTMTPEQMLHDSGADAPPANGDQQRTAKKGSLLQQIRVRDRSGCSERRHVSTGKTKDKYDKVHAVKNASH